MTSSLANKQEEIKMDTNKIKRFATLARNILLEGVSQRVSSLGFNEKGEATEEPQKFEGGATFMGEVVSTDFYDKWMSLNHAVKSKGVDEVIEEAAYTWFNRLVAIRIMVKNNLLAPVLAYESDGIRTPMLISEAEQGRMPQMTQENRTLCESLLNDSNKSNELFRILIVAYCHATPIINQCFGAIADYTELLLPTNILAKEGFIDQLNSTDYITDEDYHSPELIGWLYQFYIAEKKDNVFASFKKGKKAEAEDIPAATQIFTPNWIVKYMVQNTVGRIYLDNNPYSDIKESMQYLVENEEPTQAENILQIDDIHDLTCADLACGSGHILNECFDLLFKIYKEEGYSSKKAIEDIFKYNLTGIDLDTRAKQLAQFALLMKACQKDNSFVDAHCLPHVYDMPEAYEDKEALSQELRHFLMTDDKGINEEVMDAFTLMDEAKNLGSIMKFNISERTRNIIAQRMEEYEKEDFVSEEMKSLFPYMHIILTLTQKYSALVMNPPYMGGGNMNATLSAYVKENYAEGKSDLFSVFMMMGMDNLQFGGKMAQINMQSWMFLSSFEKLRNIFLGSYLIDSMLHLGPRTFDELSGEVVQNTAFVLTNPHYSKYGEMTDAELAALPKEERKAIVAKLIEEVDNGSFKKYIREAKGTYYRLVDGKNCTDKEQLFLSHIHGNEDGNRIYYPNVEQKNFEKIPGSPIGYWVSENFKRLYNQKHVHNYAKPIAGICTGDNDSFLRLWHEVNSSEIGNIAFEDYSQALAQNTFSWYIHYKGGSFRRWYGNRNYVLHYCQKALQEMETKKGFRHDGKQKYFQQGITWSKISSGLFSARYLGKGCTFDSTGTSAFPSDENLYNILGFLNSSIIQPIISIVNPTMAIYPHDIADLPYIPKTNNIIQTIVIDNISLSKEDWDAHETSWDFQQNELLSITEDTNLDKKQDTLEWRMEEYKQKWEHKFMQLHANEEELNRQFIDIYGLQDELTPDVPLDEITILQQGEISIENNQLVWHEDVIIKQLISYAVGCMMGRYSIDKPGLILANQGDGMAEYAALVPNSRFEIDDDGIVPLMSSNTEFTDAATKRFKTWLSVSFGEESLVENLNFVEKCLGKTIDDYFVKQFWKDHKKMYQNRPIYWLFSSKKGAFQCLVYMHRMNPYTAEKIRTNYLLPHIEWLVSKQSEMQANAANLNTRERKELDNIGKQIAECREYHDRLHVVADEQIGFDLDDGVVVNYAKLGDVLQKIK